MHGAQRRGSQAERLAPLCMDPCTDGPGGAGYLSQSSGSVMCCTLAATGCCIGHVVPACAWTPIIWLFARMQSSTSTSLAYMDKHRPPAGPSHIYRSTQNIYQRIPSPLKQHIYYFVPAFIRTYSYKGSAMMKQLVVPL